MPRGRSVIAAHAFCLPHPERCRAARSGLLRALCSTVGLGLAACGPSQAYCQQSYWERVAMGNPMLLGPNLVASGLMELTCDRGGTQKGATPQVAAPETTEPQSAPSASAKTTATDGAPTTDSAGADCAWNAQEYHYQCW